MKAYVASSGMPFVPSVEGDGNGSVRAYVQNDRGDSIQLMLRPDNKFHITMMSDDGDMHEIGSGELAFPWPTFNANKDWS